MPNQQLGHQLTGVYPIDGGQAQLFERGLTVRGAGGEVTVSFAFPMIGRPSIPVADATGIVPFGPDAITFELGKQTLEQLTPLIQRALAGRIRLQPTGLATGQQTVIVGSSVLVRPEQKLGVGGIIIPAVYGITVSTPALQERQLYDVHLLGDGGASQRVAPHAVYHRQTWTDFGIIEVNDLHVARRIDRFRGLLTQDGRTDAAQAMFNWNDRFRGFVRYANFLHGIGVLDVILAVGDVYDYIHEDTDDPASGGNAEFLRELILGRAPGPDFPDVEELLVPIFMVPGNHDYRKRAYKLVFDLNLKPQVLGGLHIRRLNNYDAYNLDEANALFLTAALDGLPNLGSQKFDAAEAAEMVDVDPGITAYRTFLADRTSYVVRIGRHRIAMLDSAADVGVVRSALEGLLQLITDDDEDEVTFVGGNPNSEGVSQEDVALVAEALTATPDDALFLLCIHAPLFNPKNDEYAYFLRETQRPAQRDQVPPFVARHGKNVVSNPSNVEGEVARIHPLWFAGEGDHRQPTFVKRGDSQDLLDFGVSRGHADDLISLLAGINARRPADLVLSGHTHNQNEFSVRKMITGEPAYYFDFYTQNPVRYYPTRFTTGWSSIDPTQPSAIAPITDVSRIEIDSDVAPDAKPWQTPYAAFSNQLQIPPYPNPLFTEADPRAWWLAHRPLVLQTGALGPEANAESFAGFRVLMVKNDVIDRIFFVPTGRLEQNHFRLSLDDAIRPDPGRTQRYRERSRPFKVPAAVGAPSGLVFPPAGVNNVIYRDGDGKIHELWQTATASGTSNLTDLADHAIRAISDPTTYHDTTQGFQVVLYRGSDGHVHSLFWSTGAVRRDALSQAAGAPPTAGKPAGFIQRDGSNMVIYRDGNGHLRSLFWTGPEPPSTEDLTALAHAPAAAGDPAPFLDTSTGSNIVAYRGTDGHIHTLFWSTGAVGHDNLSGVAGAPRAAGDPAAYYIRGNDSHQVTYRDADGHIHELFWTANNRVSHLDLSVAAGAPKAESDPVAYYSVGTNTKHVVYRSADGHLHDLRFAPGAGVFPTHIDITVAALAPLAADKPAAFTVEGPNSQHVVYRGNDGQIHEIRETPANGVIHVGLQNDWRWCNLCQGLYFGPNAAASRCPAGGRHATAVQSGSFNYTLSDEPGDNSRQSEWRWCNKCQGLFFGPDLGLARCPAGGAHATPEQSGSANYSLAHGIADPSRQSDWRWCSKCDGLFYGPNIASSRCPAGGEHAPPAQSGSVNYSILMANV